MNKFNFDRFELTRYLPSGICAEIGVAKARFSKMVVQNNNPKKLYLIDAWKNFDLGYKDSNMVSDSDHQKRFEEVRDFFTENDNIKIIRDFSVPAADKFEDNYFDWVYIDADHSYQGCLNDLNAYDSKVHKDGYICGHDWLPTGYNRKGFGVNQAVLDFVKDKGYYLLGHTNEEKYSAYVIAKTKQKAEEFLNKL